MFDRNVEKIRALSNCALNRIMITVQLIFSFSHWSFASAYRATSTQIKNLREHSHRDFPRKSSPLIAHTSVSTKRLSAESIRAATHDKTNSGSVYSLVCTRKLRNIVRVGKRRCVTKGEPVTSSRDVGRSLGANRRRENWSRKRTCVSHPHA